MNHASSSRSRSDGPLWALILLIYNVVYPILFVLMLPAYLRRMVRRGGYKDHFWQRLGIYSKEEAAAVAGGCDYWINAVSVGEFLLVRKLIVRLQELRPKARLVVSTTTSTGWVLARRLLPDDIPVIYHPVDLFWSVGSLFRRLKPVNLLLVEGQVWPNLVQQAVASGTRVALINARMSPRSEKRYRLARRLVAPLFRRLDLVTVPEAADVERWTALGVRREVIHATGNLKFDSPIDNDEAGLEPLRAIHAACGGHPGQLVFLAGSTAPGEEEVLAAIFSRLRPRFPGLMLFLVPRHAERTPEILEKLRATGLKVGLRSRPEPCGILLIDSTGELARWFSLATVVFIGKSLVGYGGQNPVEAILAGKPVLFGPHMENFLSTAARLIETGGTLPVRDAAELEKGLETLLSDADLRASMAWKAADTLAEHEGASARCLELILGMAETFS